MYGRIVLQNVQVADACVHVVINARRSIRIAVLEVRVEKVARTSADGEFAGAGLKRNVNGLRALPIHGLGVLLPVVGRTAIACKGAPMPEKNHKHQNERQRAKRRSQRNAARPCRPVRILLRTRRIPHLSEAHKYQNQKPIRSQNRPWIKRRSPVGVQKHGANRDEHNRQHKRRSTLGSTVSHGTPLRSLLRSSSEISSAIATGVCKESIPEMPTAATPHSGTPCYSREELGRVQGVRRWLRGTG